MNVSYVFLFFFPFVFFFFSKNESSEYASDVSGKVLERRQNGVSRQARKEREWDAIDSRNLRSHVFVGGGSWIYIYRGKNNTKAKKTGAKQTNP